jgi:hypothetical protein
MKTLSEMKAAGLRDLAASTPANIKRARLEETAIDLPDDDQGDERGFIVQEYAEGIIREAYFFIGPHRVALCDDEIVTVVDAAEGISPRTS